MSFEKGLKKVLQDLEKPLIQYFGGDRLFGDLQLLTRLYHANRILQKLLREWNVLIFGYWAWIWLVIINAWIFVIILILNGSVDISEYAFLEKVFFFDFSQNDDPRQVKEGISQVLIFKHQAVKHEVESWVDSFEFSLKKILNIIASESRDFPLWDQEVDGLIECKEEAITVEKLIPPDKRDLLQNPHKILKILRHPLNNEHCILNRAYLQSLDHFQQKPFHEDRSIKLVNVFGLVEDDGGFQLGVGLGLDDVQFVEVEDLFVIVDGLAVDDDLLVDETDVVLLDGRGGLG